MLISHDRIKTDAEILGEFRWDSRSTKALEGHFQVKIQVNIHVNIQVNIRMNIHVNIQVYCDGPGPWVFSGHITPV